MAVLCLEQAGDIRLNEHPLFKQSIISSKSETLDLLSYGQKISSHLIESYIDKPVIDQIVFILLLCNAKKQINDQLENQKNTSKNNDLNVYIGNLNNFFINAEYIKQIIESKHKTGSLKPSVINNKVDEVLASVSEIMLPEVSLMGFNIESNSSSLHFPALLEITQIDSDEQSIIHYQLEERLVEALSKTHYKNGKYTSLDLKMLVEFKDRFDLYLYNFTKSLLFRKKVTLQFSDFKNLKEKNTEIKYNASGFFYKRIEPSVKRLNQNNKVEFEIIAKYEPCRKRVHNREDLCQISFDIKLKKNYSLALKKIQNTCSKIKNLDGETISLSNSLILAVLRSNNCNADEIVNLINRKINEYEAKYGPTNHANDLSIIASYIRKSLEDVFKEMHFFEKFLICYKKRINGLYLKNRKPIKQNNQTFSTDLENVILDLDSKTSEILLDLEAESQKTQSLSIIDYQHIRFSIFKTHPHLKAQLISDKKKYLDLVKDAAEISELFFGSTTQNRYQKQFREALCQFYMNEGFYLSSESLKLLISSQSDLWKIHPGQKIQFWKRANEFNLKQLNGGTYA